MEIPVARMAAAPLLHCLGFKRERERERVDAVIRLLDER